MKLNRKWVASTSILSSILTLSGCGKKGSANDGGSSSDNQNDTSKPTIPLSSQSSLTLYKKTVNDNSLYLASGLGGLGIENDQDKLDLYPGIPIQTNPNFRTDVTIKINANSDNECNNIFSYTRNNNLVYMNVTNINKPLNCNLSLSMTSSNVKTGIQEVTSSNDIKLRLNLTMNAYMYNKDPNYLKYSGVQFIDDYKIRDIVKQIRTTKKIVFQDLNLDNFNFLEGAKDIVQTIEIKNSIIGDYGIFKEFKNLKDVSLDKVNINDSNVKEVLSMLPKIDRLSIQDNGLTNIRPIIDIQPDLKELDISGNPIQNLSEIKSLLNLNKVSIRKMNLTTLLPLNSITQIKDLDISENPLRKFTDADTGYLSSLINLEALNVSVDRDNPNSSPITDKVLNDYFRSLVIDSRPQKLKKFVARNRWEKKSKDCNMINNFKETVGAINLLKNIEYLDLHGNGCVDLSWGVGMYSGLTEIPLMNYSNLRYLNISDTPARTFNSSIDWRNVNITFIFNETPSNYDTGVFMTRKDCLSTFPEGNKNRIQCDGLDPDLKSNE